MPARALTYHENQPRKENKRLARHATFDFVASTHGKMQEISGLLPPGGSSTEDIKTFLKKADERSSDEFVALRDYLNMLENLLVGVNMEVFDIEIIDRTSGARIMRAWNWYKDWIRRERTRTGQHTLWTELEEGASKIERRRLPHITIIQPPA
jgi:hypothetical protein